MGNYFLTPCEVSQALLTANCGAAEKTAFMGCVWDKCQVIALIFMIGKISLVHSRNTSISISSRFCRNFSTNPKDSTIIFCLTLACYFIWITKFVAFIAADKYAEEEGGWIFCLRKGWLVKSPRTRKSIVDLKAFFQFFSVKNSSLMIHNTSNLSKRCP